MNVNITVTAIFSLVHAGIYRAAQSVFTLELNTVRGVIQLGVTYRACRIRQVAVRCCSERQAVNLAAHSAVRCIEGSARITDFHPIANLVVNGNRAVIPHNVRGFQLLVIIELAVNRLVDRTFPVLIVINRVSGWGHQLQRMGLSVVPEMIRNIDRNHAKLSDLVAALIDDIGTHHTGGRQVRDDVLAVAVYNTVIVNAIRTMNNNFVTGIIGHAIRGREQCIQVTNNTGNTSDANIRLIVQLQNRQRTFGHIRTKVPAVVLAAGIHTVCSHTCVIKHRLIVACELNLINVCVPVTGEVLDGLPAFRQCQVIRQLIAAIQWIPESAASLQSRQNLLCVDGGNTNQKMNIFLAILLCCTNLALFTLRDVHDSVGEQTSLGHCSGVFRQVTNLVHQEIACTRQVEVACTEPGLTSLFVGNGLGSRVRIIAELSTSHVTACVINPNGAESNLRVRVCLRSGKRATEVIWEVGRNTIFDSALGLRTGVRLQFHTQLVRAVHNTSLTVGAVRTTSGQNHRNSIGRKDCTRINVATVSAHQSIHVPVTVINVGNTVQNIITGRGIVLVGPVSAALVIITRTRVGITSLMGIVPGTSICIHRIVADTHTVALAQECLDSIIGFTGKVGFLINADTPADRVNSIITLGIHHITVRVLVKSFNLNRKDRNMLVCLLSTCIFQPSVIRNIRMGQKLGIHTPGIRYPGVQEHNGIFVFRTRSTSAIAAIVAKHSRVSRNINCSASQIPVVAVVMRTKIDGLTIPLRVDFKFVTISQGKAHVFAGSTSRKFIIIQHICRKVTRIERPTNLRPIAVSSGFVDFASIEPFGYLVVHVFGDVLVVAIQASNPLATPPVARAEKVSASIATVAGIRRTAISLLFSPSGRLMLN